MTSPKLEEVRIPEFEQKVMQRLDEILALLQASVSKVTGDDEDRVTTSWISGVPLGRPAKGRRSKLAFSDLLERRRLLIEIFEQFCPEILAALRNATNATEAAEALKSSVSAWNGVRPPILWETSLYAEQLWNFLNSSRFNFNLRNLANAMAGVPEMSWKRSFDLCVKNPPTPPIPLHPRAIRDFLHRNFPERLQELESAKTLKEVKMILAKSRSKDPRYLKLKENKNWVLGWLKSETLGELESIS
jgi:hypothetical protein